AARLDDRFRLLTGGSRVAVARHQTLRAAMDWSYELLADDERALLRRMSVFHGGFALEAAEAVAAGDLVDEADVLDLLGRLVDKSLVQVEARTTEQRYDLSGIVRQYADERLVESDEAFEARRRHRDWCLRLVEQAAPRLQRGPDAAMWLDRLDLEHDNLSAALDWSADEPGEAEAGLRLAEGLWRFCEIRGHLAEGRGWLERMLEAAPAADSPLRANALTGAGLLAFIQGDYAAALAFHEQSLELHRRLGDATAVAYATNNLANAALQQGDLDRARELYEQSLVLARQQDRHGYAFGLVNTADVLQRQGEYAAAQGRFRESITMFRELGDPWGEAYALDEFGRVARREGDVETARILHADALAIARSMGDQGSAARALANQADLAASEGDLSRSRMLHRESLATRMAMRDLPGVATGLERLAATIVDDDPDAAARLIGAAEALREATRARLPLASRAEHDRVVEALEATLGGEAFAAARAVGRRSSPDEVLATLPP
ncbi:MAG: tetratricopeptide repeat protein, partial [Candidatus Limnocylindrales bacterium]